MAIDINHVTDTIADDGGRSPALGNALKTIWVPAGSMTPTVTNGCAALATVETTALRPDISHLAFVTGADNHAQFNIVLPKSFDGGTLTYAAYWTGLVAGAGGVSWALQAVAVSNDATLDVAYGTAIVVDDTFIVLEDIHISPTSTAVTIAGTPADADYVSFQVFRDVSDANDTRAFDANLLGVALYLTFDHTDDT